MGGFIPAIVTPASAADLIAERTKAARLRRGWSRQELARRAGVAPETIKAFEGTGRITLGRLLAIAGALSALKEFTEVLPSPVARSLDELEAGAAPAAPRRRGRTLTPASRHAR